MHDRHTPSAYVVIGQRNRGRLVVVFQYCGIMFQLVNEGKFDLVALELDNGAHFAAGIAPGNVSATTSNTASRIATPYHGNRGTCRFRQPKPCTPAEKLSLEHLPPPLRKLRNAACYYPSCKLRSLFLANVYLRPASATIF